MAESPNSDLILKVPFAPFYDRDGVTIFNCDCRQVLPFLGAVDITFSSPPYNQIPLTAASGLMAESKRKLTDGYDTHTDDMPEPEYRDFVRDVFGLCRDITKGLVWINHKTRFRDRTGIHPLHLFDWPFYSEIVWDRCGSITLNARKFAPSHEFIYGFGEPHYWDDSLNTLLSVWRINPEREIKSHPCPFPESIAARCITASCPLGGVVLEPFMGSGTTLVAARQNGRRAVGIEISREYCEAAVERLRQKVLNFGEDA